MGPVGNRQHARVKQRTTLLQTSSDITRYKMMDSYSTRARMFPVYVTITPTILALAALLPEGLELPLAGAAAVVLLPLSFLASQVGADFGKRLEKDLWEKWGGPPTTRFLRHGNSEFNPISRQRVHTKLESFGFYIRSAEEDRKDQETSDSHWEACTEELIRRTRNRNMFPLVFKGLVEYGFRRNLLGLKPFGLSICILALFACGWKLCSTWPPDAATAVEVTATLLSAALLSVWLFWVTEKIVAISANRYARFLLEASLEMD